MLPSSHLALRIAPAPALPGADARLLADAFSEFIAASTRLEDSYRDLQAEVALLGSELAARNAALERSLRENEGMRLQLVEILDSMPCGVLVLDGDEKLLRINEEAKRLLRVEGEAEDLTCLAKAAAVDLRPFRALSGESEFAMPSPCETGEERWVNLRTRHLSESCSEGESRARAILILRDISAQKQAEGERESARRAVALAEIAATLAHEIRNPLASLELFVALLAEEPGRTGEWVEHLRAGLRGLAGTVNNVLAFHGVSGPRLQAVPLAAEIAAAAEFVRPIAEQSGLRLVFFGAGERGEVLASAAGLQQIVLNLVTNAVRHTRAPGEIRITVERAGGERLRLAVADTGSGIAPEHLPRIFEAGWSARGESSGLGLAVCRRIAAQLGTRIAVESVPGRGATFSMELPLV